MFAYLLETFRDSLWQNHAQLWCGSSITLSHLGVAPEDIARHVGWKSLETAEYYFQTWKVMGLYYSKHPHIRTLILEVRLIRFLYIGRLVKNQPEGVLKLFLKIGGGNQNCNKYTKKSLRLN